MMTPRQLVGLTIGIVLLAAACAQQQEDASTANQVRSVQEGSKAPQFVLPSAAGEKMSLSEFRGRKPVLLYFSMGPG